MSLTVQKGVHIIDENTRSLISDRNMRITRAVNRTFWNSESESTHSFYVGSYGRGTATNTSDIDILVELPESDYNSFAYSHSNGPSRLLQIVKNSILVTYPSTNIRGDGQVVVVNFSDGMKFEILPAFSTRNLWGTKNVYKYPDTNMGGNWMTTNPKAEQDVMQAKNSYYESNGLLFDTCKHIRYVRDNFFASYHLSGILIDTFCYNAIKDWHWLRDNESSSPSSKSYEQIILDYYNMNTDYYNRCTTLLQAPGSGQAVDTKNWDILGKILNAIA